MRKIHLVIFVYINSVCFARDISEQYNRISENTSQGSRLTQGNMGGTEESWQPMSHSNWIMLNTALQKEPTTSVQASSNLRSNVYSRNSHHLLTPLNGGPYTQTEVSFQRNQKQEQQEWEKKQQEPPQGLPLNYYTYNHSSGGNYRHPSTTDVKLIEPYFVTISKMHAHKEPKANALLARRVSIVDDATSSYGAAITLPKDVVGNVVSVQEKWSQGVENIINPGVEVWSNNGRRTDATTTSASNENNNEAANDFDEIAADGENLNEILLPLRRTLDGVIQICDMAKRFITSEDDETDNDIEDKEAPNDNDLDNANEASEINSPVFTAPGRVQGYHNISPKPTMLSLMGISSQPTGRSRATTDTMQDTMALSSVGTGRKVKKLKKKFRKFLLPLLLAYKLKFLTLIPVFIGGLTLLVGTTGLAGFFFALFTAVMSLKSTGGSKSIIVKKI